MVNFFLSLSSVAYVQGEKGHTKQKRLQACWALFTVSVYAQSYDKSCSTQGAHFGSHWSWDLSLCSVKPSSCIEADWSNQGANFTQDLSKILEQFKPTRPETEHNCKDYFSQNYLENITVLHATSTEDLWRFWSAFQSEPKSELHVCPLRHQRHLI